MDNNPQETYGIYSSSTPFANTSQAQLLGRLFEEEWLPYAMRTQVDSTATYVIANGGGDSFTLPTETGLFVETVHEPGSKYYTPVVKWGNTNITNNFLPQLLYDTVRPANLHQTVQITSKRIFVHW